MNLQNSLDIPEREPCAFCQYLAGERPYTVLERGETIALLVTREQRGIGHILAIPVRHRESILDLSERESDDLMRAVRRAAAAIDRAFRRPGIAIWQNNGVAANQMIPHMHFHIAGTLPGGGTDFGKILEISVADTDAIADDLRTALLLLDKQHNSSL